MRYGQDRSSKSESSRSLSLFLVHRDDAKGETAMDLEDGGGGEDPRRV